MKKADKWHREVRNMSVVRELEDLPRSYHDEYIRVKKKAKPFELKYPEVVSMNLWVSIYLFGEFLNGVQVDEIEAEKPEVVQELILRFVERYATDPMGEVMTVDPIDVYILEYCSSRPLKLPSKKGYEKFKLMNELE